MTNNQKIELSQAPQVECKHCLNCTAWVPSLTDWDVMQSGYSEKQLYPQQFNLTIEQMRQILDNAPDGATGFMNVEDDKYNCYVKFTSEWSKQNKHAYWGKDALTGEYRWSFMANMFGGHDLTCGLVELSDLQKYVDQYTTSKPKQQLEVLEMHDVPCTTVVIES